MLFLGSHLLEVLCSTPLPKTSPEEASRRHVQGWNFKVNFHTDNVSIVDKIIDVLAPFSDLDHTLRDELCGLRTDVYTFLS